jgi:hypothetical protein
MPKSHPPYALEFRQRIVELVRKGRTPKELARQFEPSAQAIRLGRPFGLPDWRLVPCVRGASSA